MNGIDYSRKLDVERQNYRQKADESRRASESYTKDIKENSENKIEEIRENSLKHKASLESKFKDSYENLDRSSKDALLDKQLSFNKKLDTDRAEFSSIRKENLEDFNRRIKVLNDSYKTSVNDLKETSSDRGENLRAGFDAKISTIESDKEQKLKEIQDRSIDANRKITVDYRNEKDGIVKTKDDELHKLAKDEQVRRNTLKESAVKSIEDLRRDQSVALNREQNIANSRFQGLKINSDERIQQLDEKNTHTMREVNQKTKDDSHYKVLTEERNNSARELGKVKKETREKVERISKTYAGDLEGVQLRADAQVDMVKKSTTEEKNELQSNLQSVSQDNLSQERKIQNEKYSKMEQSFHKKFLSMQNKNSETKNAYENKMKSLITATNDKIQKTTEDMKKTTESQLKIERDNNESKLKQLRDSMAILRSTSDKKLNDQRLQNTQKVSELTYGFEQKLKNQESRLQDVIDQNQRKAEIDQDRLRLASTQEKETIMAQYEQRLERMESMNNQKLTNMEKYAGLQISQKRSSIQA
jgi:hypothetical protein